MPHRRRSALTALSLLILLAAGAPAPAAVLEHLGTSIWRDSDPHFGGFSAIEMDPDGIGFHGLTDRAHLYQGSLRRDAQGMISSIEITGRTRLKDNEGRPLTSGRLTDSEGLAIDGDGRIWVSFEGRHRIAAYDRPGGPATQESRVPPLPGMRRNAGLEALAIRKDGMLIAVPERSAHPGEPFQVLGFRDGEWHHLTRIRRDPRWLPVGADFGPDGWFYLLERDFRGPLGFASRVRRMILDDDGPQEEQILLETRSMEHDNLEGISVWHDGQNIRVTMISDDNFLFLQRTEIVEYRLIEQKPLAVHN